MKTLWLIFGILIGANLLAQEPYRYLEVNFDKGSAWINIRPTPATDKLWLEDDCVSTVSFDKFSTAELGITQPEGFFLVQELNYWFKVSDSLGQEPPLLNQVPPEAITKLAENLSRQLFGECLCSLPRDKFLLLWLNLSRAVVNTNLRHVQTSSSYKSEQAALTGKFVWDLIVKSWTVEDIFVFALHQPGKSSVNLLVDAGGNIMTKVMMFPELHYHKDYSYNLVEKSSKDLRNFALCKK